MLLDYFNKKKLINIGFRGSFNSINKDYWVLKFRKYISFCDSKSFSTDELYYTASMEMLIRFIKDFIEKFNLFLLVSLNRDSVTATSIFKSMQKNLYNYFVYDWIFGIVSNHKRIFKACGDREVVPIRKVPDIGIVLQAEDWTTDVIWEMKHRGVFTIGFINSESVHILDFPFPLSDNFESSFIIMDRIICETNIFFCNLLYNNILNQLDV